MSYYDSRGTAFHVNLDLMVVVADDEIDVAHAEPRGLRHGAVPARRLVTRARRYTERTGGRT